DTKPGTQATVTVWRKGRTTVLPIIVVATPSDKMAKVGERPAPPPKAQPRNPLGVTVRDISPDQKKAQNLHGGVEVQSVEGPAARVGLEKGDIILRIGVTDVASAKDFDHAVAHLDPQKTVAVLVRRGDDTQFVPMRPRVAMAQE
ncbi:MAG: serine protease Do, partial [Paraburkholderia sp.]|nr:serine protease Do [Paraburkholderia sp.]